MSKLRRSMSLLQSGDVYVFNGLRVKGTPPHYQCPDDGRRMTIFNISTSGSVTYRLDFNPPDAEPGDRPYEPELFSLPLDLLELLIDQQIWQPLSDIA